MAGCDKVLQGVPELALGRFAAICASFCRLRGGFGGHITTVAWSVGGRCLYLVARYRRGGIHIGAERRP
ncbi:hypothetical protein G6F23_016041 [Rhizopus arrhizus]|nr:hypothetical protein G6F23_016041 [Rhizopus arrhizus]